MSNARILNVDDHEAGRYARTRFLTRAGFEVEEARDGVQALAIIQQRPPDLVLLDINLPGIDGFEVCRRIRSDADHSRIPILFLSAARLQDLDVVTGLEHGGDNYLREPIDPSVLVATIRALLRLKDAEEALVRSNEQLRRFAFIVSHELQEPLRMVKSYTQLLSQRYSGVLTGDANEFMRYTVMGVSRMEKFIQDMLSFSQAAEAQVDMDAFECGKALDWALMELQPAIAESNASIASDPLPLVLGDPMRLSQVFKNLIGNAIKYRSDRPLQVHVSSTEQENEYTICIHDNGIGIDPKYFDSIFGLFKRLHGREVSGSGVGLSICKEIVEHHGGRIWVESDPGQGSSFCFTLPKVSGERAAFVS